MRILKYISVISGLILLASCQEELVYDPFETSENGMERYLAKVTQVSYATSGSTQTESINELFSNPNFDSDGKLLNAYVNFTGRQANNAYAYMQDKIVVTSITRDNKNYVFEYSLDNNIITDCIESSDVDNENYHYSYKYNSDKCLSSIIVNKNDDSFTITLNWNKGNMVSVKVLYDSGYTSIYSYEYTHDKNYNPIFPQFWISCFEIGGVYGVDEILSSQGFFGKNYSNDLIQKEYFNGNLSREFEYNLDNKGNIVEVLDINSNRNKILRKYTLEWR